MTTDPQVIETICRWHSQFNCNIWPEDYPQPKPERFDDSDDKYEMIGPHIRACNIIVGGRAFYSENCRAVDGLNEQQSSLSMKARDIMNRRGWMPVRFPNGWIACQMASGELGNLPPLIVWAGVNEALLATESGNRLLAMPPIAPTSDPFLCLVEADEWMTEQERIHSVNG